MNATLQGVIHTIGTSQIIILNNGVYLITYQILGVQPNQYALFADNVMVLGSNYSSGAGNQQNNGQVVCSLIAGTVLTLRNHTSHTQTQLQTSTGGTSQNVNASIIINKIG
jgi:hypothetical protein